MPGKVQIRPGLKEHFVIGKNLKTLCGMKNDFTYVLFKDPDNTCKRCLRSFKKNKKGVKHESIKRLYVGDIYQE